MEGLLSTRPTPSSLLVDYRNNFFTLCNKKAWTEIVKSKSKYARVALDNVDSSCQSENNDNGKSTLHLSNGIHLKCILYCLVVKFQRKKENNS